MIDLLRFIDVSGDDDISVNELLDADARASSDFTISRTRRRDVHCSGSTSSCSNGAGASRCVNQSPRQKRFPHPRLPHRLGRCSSSIDENHDGRVTGRELTAWLERWAHDGEVVEAAAGPAEERGPAQSDQRARRAAQKDKTPAPSTVHEFWNLHSEEVLCSSHARLSCV